VPIQSNPEERFTNPKSEKMLKTKNGIKILNPTEALNPTPIRSDKISSLFIIVQRVGLKIVILLSQSFLLLSIKD